MKSMSFAASNAKRVATLLIGLPTNASPFKAIAPTTVAAFKKFPSAPLSQPHRPWGCFGLSWDATPYRVCIGCWRVRCSPLCAIAAVIAISPSATPLAFHTASQAAAHRIPHVAAISRKLTNSPSCDSISGAGDNPDKPLCDPVPTQRDRGAWMHAQEASLLFLCFLRVASAMASSNRTSVSHLSFMHIHHRSPNLSVASGTHALLIGQAGKSMDLVGSSPSDPQTIEPYSASSACIPSFFPWSTSFPHLMGASLSVSQL